MKTTRSELLQTPLSFSIYSFSKAKMVAAGIMLLLKRIGKFAKDFDYHYTWYLKKYIELFQNVTKLVKWWSLHYNEHVLREVLKFKNVVPVVRMLMNLQSAYEGQQDQAKKLYRKVEQASMRQIQRKTSIRSVRNIDLNTAQMVLRDSERDKDLDILYNACYFSALLYISLPLFQIMLILFFPIWMTILILLLPPTFIALIIITASLSIIQSII